MKSAQSDSRLSFVGHVDSANHWCRARNERRFRHIFKMVEAAGVEYKHIIYLRGCA
jgi:hypothetical protein